MYCSDIPSPIFFIFNTSVPSTLLYYSHIPTALIALFVGIYVYRKNSSLLTAKLLLALTIVFSLWSFSDLVVWTNIDSRIVMFAWSLFGLFFALISIFSLYFHQVFLNNEQDISLKEKAFLVLLLLPVILFLPTHFSVEYFDITYCEATDNHLYESYYYLLGLFSFVWILAVSVWKIWKEREPKLRKQKLFFTIGIEFFLASFFLSSYFASYLDNFKLEQYGLFGMLFFVGFLAYLIVKFQAFEIRLLGVQALVMALVFLIGAQFFFIRTVQNRILTSVTLVLVMLGGVLMIRSVKNEIRRKEEIQSMATKLAIANDELRRLDSAKSEFISIASHQLRTPLTAIKGFVSLMLEGSYGKLSPQIEDVLNKVYTANNHLVELVENLLNISRIESGRMQYQFALADLADILRDLSDAFSVIAKGRNLDISFSYPDTPISPFVMDGQKIREVVSNMIDNAIKYTPEGSISVRLEQQGDIVRVSVSDTGVGIASDDLGRLFQKFRRGKESEKVNVSGTGLGLYVGKNFVEAHKGRLYAESEGIGKGSKFVLELPFRTAESESEEE